MIEKLLLVAVAAFASASHASVVEVQRIRLGMTHQEFASAYPKGVHSGITIGGASSQRGFEAAAVQFRDGRLEQFSAYFAGSDFDRVRRAVVAKNPSVQCSGDQQLKVCFDPEGSFVLTRNAGQTLLLLQSQRMAAEAESAFSDLQTTAIGAGRTGM
jgi:hypothetical protein